jgi:hypothetical protein
MSTDTPTTVSDTGATTGNTTASTTAANIVSSYGTTQDSSLFAPTTTQATQAAQVSDDVSASAGSGSGGGTLQKLKAATAIVGGVSKFASSMNAGSNQEQAGKNNAATLESEAQNQTHLGEQNASSSRKQYETLAGKQKAAYGASGVSSASGSPLTVLSNTYAAQEQDANRIKWSSDIAAKKLRNQEYNVKLQAKNAANKSYSQGIDSLLTTANDVSKLWG